LWSATLRLFLIVFGLLAALYAGSGHAANFSQFPGFDEWYAAHPPSDNGPTANQQELLRKHRPRFFLPSGHDGLSNFYGTYLVGTLFDGDGSVISNAPDRVLLNAHKSDPEAVFVPSGERKNPSIPKVLGRYDQVKTRWQNRDRVLVFLTYHAVFERSGLPGGLLGWQKLALGLLGNLKDWHQLDHYTAATLVLDEERQPLAMMLQQHNYQRTYILGELVELPEDGRMQIDVAIGSNELFPHARGRRNHRAVPFPTPANMRYLIGSGGRPFMTADDVTEPVREQEYTLDFLPSSDAFYTFKGYLGEKRLLPGRTGPPGADYNTLPDMKTLDMQLLSGYWREENAGDIERLERALRYEKYWRAFAEGQRDVFFANAVCAQRWGENCSFD
jgi:hypothetical protein